jgi:hypothetical protein
MQALHLAAAAAALEVIPVPAAPEVVTQAQLVLQQQQVVEQAAVAMQSLVLILHKAAAEVLDYTVLDQTERLVAEEDLEELMAQLSEGYMAVAELVPIAAIALVDLQAQEEQ